MPIYEYQCEECGEEFEKIVRLSQADHRQGCPSCQSQNTRKKISTIASCMNSLSGTSVSTNSSCDSRGGFS